MIFTFSNFDNLVSELLIISGEFDDYQRSSKSSLNEVLWYRVNVLGILGFVNVEGWIGYYPDWLDFNYL